jgi:hypothetical protein
MMTTLRTVFWLLAGLGFAFSGLAQSFLTNGLVAYYPFNGNANDASGKGVNGVPIGAPTLTADRFGVPDRAYHFNGGTDSIYVPQVAVSTESNAINTVSFWMKWDGSFYAPSDPAGFAFAWGNSSGLVHYGGAINPRPSPPVMGLTGNRSAAIFGTYFVSNAIMDWIHVVAEFNNGDVKTGRVFTNGVAVDALFYESGFPTGATMQTAATTNAFISGYSVYPDRYRFVGSIDDVRIYNRALSSNEVAQLYAIESGPRVGLIKAVKPSFSYLSIGTNYQLQVSGDINTWTNHGAPFTATNSSMVYPEYWDVENWGELFFRLR